MVKGVHHLQTLGWLGLDHSQGARFRRLDEDAKVAPPNGKVSTKAAGRHSALFHSQQVAATSEMALASRKRGQFLEPERPLEVDVSSTSHRKVKGRISFDTQDVEDALEKSEEAEAVTSLASAELRKVLEESNEASEDALAAAQVAVITEAVAFIGCLAGLASSWIGWKMHTAQLPPESKIPSDSGVPPELLTPPPGRIGTTTRASKTTVPAKAAPQPKATVPSRGAAEASATSSEARPAATSPPAVPETARHEASPATSPPAGPETARHEASPATSPPAGPESARNEAEAMDLTLDGEAAESF